VQVADSAFHKPPFCRQVLECASPLALLIRRTGPKRQRTLLLARNSRGLNPNGILPQSPGLRGTSYPGEFREHGVNPNGVAASAHGRAATLLGLVHCRVDAVSVGFMASRREVFC